MSASRRLSASQTAVITALAAGTAAFGLTAGAAALAFAAALGGAMFFTLIVAIRIYCLLPSPRVPAPIPPDLSDDALPDYTVLVPVFKETAILNQLVRALIAIDYPALCSKRTKGFADFCAGQSHD
jgi:hypothetical protein